MYDAVQVADGIISNTINALTVELPESRRLNDSGTIFSWNQFLIPLILGGRDARVITTEIARYSGAEDAIAQWGALAALSVVIVLPVIVLGLAFNRYLIRGLLGRGGD